MKGRCLCGNVSFEITGKSLGLYQCHCSECRKATGSSASAAALVDREKLRWTGGEDKIASFVKDSGYRSDFCSVCGSPVPNSIKNTGKFWVPAGLLEETGDLAVVMHLYMNSSASWEAGARSAEEYEESPGLDLLIRALHRESR